MEIKGNVDRIIYHNEDNGYSIFTLNSNGDYIDCTGYLDGISEDDYLTIEGEYTTHKIYGKQFKSKLITRTLPHSVRSFSSYLQKTINGVGPSTAIKIVDAFGENTFEIIEKNPMRLTEISGISKKKAKSISTQFAENNISREEQMYFLNLGLSPSFVVKIKNAYGNDYKKIIGQNPYKLIDDISGIGFMKADKIAMALNISKESMFRVKYGLLFFMEQRAIMYGHTMYPITLVKDEAGNFLNVPTHLVETGLSDLLNSSKLISEDGYIYLPKYYNMEQFCVKKLAKILNSKNNATDNDIVQKIKDVEKESSVTLDETQRCAVENAIKDKVSIITGGPGVGKTTTLNILIKYFKKHTNFTMELAAPTGRAAKRMTEQTGIESQTIHRLIGSTPDDEFGETTILTDVLIIDEMSMVDIPLFYKLLNSTMDYTKIILVGDIDQLPSVGPGRVLKDLIKSEKINVSKLTKIHRQADTSNIIINAYGINNGEKIDLNAKNDDFVFVPRNDESQVLKDIETLITKNIPNRFKIKPTDIQILAPQRKGTLGVENLNATLRDVLNPKDTGKAEIVKNGITFREGDKVMHIKNDYDIEWHDGEAEGFGVFNGEIGYITKIDKIEEYVTIKFDDKEAYYDYENLSELEHAYAITIHKSQGSEFPVVIMPLLKSGMPDLYNRNLLYTGVTRAKDSIVIIGKSQTVYSMIRNTKVRKRYTNLSGKLKDYNAS